MRHALPPFFARNRPGSPNLRRYAQQGASGGKPKALSMRESRFTIFKSEKAMLFLT
jgi:hypothetical protein